MTVVNTLMIIPEAIIFAVCAALLYKYYYDRSYVLIKPDKRDSAKLNLLELIDDYESRIQFFFWSYGIVYLIYVVKRFCMILAYACLKNPRGLMIKDKFYSFFCLNMAEVVIFFFANIFVFRSARGDLEDNVTKNFLFWLRFLVIYGWLSLTCFCSSCFLVFGVVAFHIAGGTFKTKRYDEHYAEAMAKQKADQVAMKSTYLESEDNKSMPIPIKVGDYISYSEFDEANIFLRPQLQERRHSSATSISITQDNRRNTNN